MTLLVRSLKIVALSLGLVFVSACCGQGSHLLRNDRTKVVQALRSTVALVREKDPEDGSGWSGRPYCSAFWISRTEIVSAAHCFTNRVVVDGFRFELPTQYVGKEAHFVSYGQITDDGDIVDGVTPSIAKIIWASEEQDVAILKANRPIASHPWFHIAKREPRPGETVSVVGHPVGLVWTFSVGYVSRIWHFEEQKPSTLIQTSAPVYFGNSGGILLNERGEALGVCHALIGNQSTINFFVGIDQVRRGLREIRNRH